MNRDRCQRLSAEDKKDGASVRDRGAGDLVNGLAVIQAASVPKSIASTALLRMIADEASRSRWKRHHVGPGVAFGEGEVER